MSHLTGVLCRRRDRFASHIIWTWRRILSTVNTVFLLTRCKSHRSAASSEQRRAFLLLCYSVVRVLVVLAYLNITLQDDLAVTAGVTLHCGLYSPFCRRGRRAFLIPVLDLWRNCVV